MAKAMRSRLVQDAILKLHRLCDPSDEEWTLRRAAKFISGDDEVVDEEQGGVLVKIGYKTIEFSICACDGKNSWMGLQNDISIALGLIRKR